MLQSLLHSGFLHVQYRQVTWPFTVFESCCVLLRDVLYVTDVLLIRLGSSPKAHFCLALILLERGLLLSGFLKDVGHFFKHPIILRTYVLNLIEELSESEH